MNAKYRLISKENKPTMSSLSFPFQLRPDQILSHQLLVSANPPQRNGVELHGQ
jgi:hypothetical protein